MIEATSRVRAERKLAALLLIHADIDIEPSRLGEMIRAHWSKLAPLAHLVHAQPDNTKGSMDNTKAPTASTNPEDGWIKWSGGGVSPPVDPDTPIEVRLISDEPYLSPLKGRARDFGWQSRGNPGSIGFYRVVKTP